jgi:crotonobetainyl-CoA hydratase
METQYEGLLVERVGKTMILTLNRPEAGNSINGEVAWGLESSLNIAEADPDVAVVILTGAGEKIFCGGMDLKHLSQFGNKGVNFEGHGFAGFAERWFPKPIIAAINGSAMGGGTEFALACDLVVAAEHAKFGLPEVKRGILAAAGGPIRLARQIPTKIAAEILLTGDSITAQRAYEIGMINKIVAMDKLREEALALADRIIANAPVPVRAAKELMYQSFDLSLKDSFALSLKLKEKVYLTDDSKEGPRAFAEKREPQWTGR